MRSVLMCASVSVVLRDFCSSFSSASTWRRSTGEHGAPTARLATGVVPDPQSVVAVRRGGDDRRLRLPGDRAVSGTDFGGAVDPRQELVFVLLIGTVWLRRSVRHCLRGARRCRVPGRSCPSSMSQPEGAADPFATAASALVPALSRRRGVDGRVHSLGEPRMADPPRRALMSAASAIVAATLATFLKSSTDTSATDGFTALLTRAEVYGSLSTVVAGTVLHAGGVALRPLGGLAGADSDRRSDHEHRVGIWLYGEHFTGVRILAGRGRRDRVRGDDHRGRRACADGAVARSVPTGDGVERSGSPLRCSAHRLRADASGRCIGDALVDSSRATHCAPDPAARSAGSASSQGGSR